MSIPKEEMIDVLIDTPHYMPCISILMPFEPKMGLKKELNHRLKLVINKIEHELQENYPEEKVAPVMKKLLHLVTSLNFQTHKKSIALFVSPLIEKVYYLDVPIEEKIIIDDSFEIRDLIYSKKEINKYLLAVLSAKWVKVYLGNTHHFVRITLNIPETALAYLNDAPEKIANFSDEQKRKEVLLDKFLRHTDNALSLLIQSYQLPLFVMGTIRTIGHFKQLTHNEKHVVNFIHGNFEDYNEAALQKLMQPYLLDWKRIKQSKLLRQIEDAMDKRKLAKGIMEVWKSASQKKGRLLVVEKNYIFPANQSSNPELIFNREESLKNAFYIKDAVDDIIEKVISSGGEVEFAEPGWLDSYDKIVLIEYYAGEH